MKVRKIKRGTITEEITDQIKSLIASGSLKPGDKLPSERELAEMFGVGRPSVREAMHALAFVGVLEIRPGDGTYLSETKVSLSDNFLSDNPAHRYTSFELIEVRQAIEVESAALAAVRSTDEDKEKIMHTCQQTLNSKGNQEEYVKADLLFHEAIAEATQNRFMVQMLQMARGLEKNPLYYRIHSDPHMQEAVLLHLDMAQAIADGNTDLARLSMGWHFELMKKALHNMNQHSKE